MSVNYGITATGFNPKPTTILEELAKSLLQQMFGKNVALDQQSTMWKIEQVPLTEVSQIWLQAEQNFYNCFIQTADGVALDLLGEDIGLERKQAIAGQTTLKIYKTGTGAVTVPADSLFQTADEIVYATDEEITIPVGDPATEVGEVSATAVEAGTTGNVPVNSILYPVYTISGVDSSDNESAVSNAKDIETDSEYRKRLRAYVRATWTAAAIRSAALNVDGVAGVKVIEAATSYQCLIVPQTTYTTELEDEVEAAIELVTPITVEFTVIEAESVEIDIVADVVLESLYDEISAEADAEVEISEYIATLGIDDDVIKAKVTQAIMEVEGILNAYNIVLTGKPIEEKHTYSTGTLDYALNYTTGVDSASVVVTGIKSGSPYTFVKGASEDYEFGTSPAEINWTGTGDLPDNGTEFKVTYTYPANSIGDVVIRQENIAKFGSVDFTEV